MRGLVLALLAVALISGCDETDRTLTTNSPSIAINGPAAGAIAGDLANRLAEQIGPATTTTIKMDEDSSEFGSALEAALKGWGFTVIASGQAGGEGKPLELAYSCNTYNGQTFAQVTTSSIALGRTYALTADGATPISPLSIMRRN